MPSTDLVFTQTLDNKNVGFVTADGTTAKTLYTFTGSGGIVRHVNIASGDTAARNVQLILNDGVADAVLTTVPVPIGSGNNGTAPSVDGLSGYVPSLPVDNNGKRVLACKAGCVLKARMLVAVTAATQIDVSVGVENY